MDSVPESEMAVLRVLWALGSPAIRDVVEALEREGITWKYATVQTLLERLEQRGLIERDREGWPHRFETVLTAQQFAMKAISGFSGSLIGQVFGMAAGAIIAKEAASWIAKVLQPSVDKAAGKSTNRKDKAG